MTRAERVIQALRRFNTKDMSEFVQLYEAEFAAKTDSKPKKMKPQPAPEPVPEPGPEGRPEPEPDPYFASRPEPEEATGPNL